MFRTELRLSSRRLIMSVLVALTISITALAPEALAEESSPEAMVGTSRYWAPVSSPGDGSKATTDRRLVLPRSALEAMPRIVGGQETTIGQWPWQVALTVNPAIVPGLNGFERHVCGGTLVTSKLVVTAAHCLFDGVESAIDGFDDSDFDPSGLYAAITGRTQLSSSGGQETDVATYYIPYDGNGVPLYDPVTQEWDVVIVELASSSASQTIKIAGPDEGALWEPGRAAYVTGWGHTSEDGSGSDFLRQAKVEIISDSTCGSPGSYGADFIADTMLCAGVVGGGTDACQGDSGGPLVVPTAAGGYRLVGDTSWGVGCARPNLPGIYGRLAGNKLRTLLGDGIQSIAGVNVVGSGAQPPTTNVYRARIRVRVKGPSRIKVRRGRKILYKVKITNSGNAQAKGVSLRVKANGRTGLRKRVGAIAAGKTRTVVVKARALGGAGKVVLVFRVKSRNAGGKTVKKNFRIKR